MLNKGVMQFLQHLFCKPVVCSIQNYRHLQMMIRIIMHL